MLAELRLTILEHWDSLLSYFGGKFISDLRAPYFPSFVSFALITILIASFFFIPQPPRLSVLLHWSWQDWWRAFTEDLSDHDTKVEGLIVGAFTGLALVVIALIVFVAESIRDDKDYERKRVQVRISFLWPLGLAATLVPFGLLWSPARGFTILLESVLAGTTLVAFGRVIRALFDPEVRASDRLALLRSRVRAMIFESARERVGNSVLLEQLGPGKRIETIHYMGRGWLEGGPQTYVFIDALEDGWISDIQLDELHKLGDQLDRHARETFGFALRDSGPDIQAATTDAAAVASPKRSRTVHRAYLLKRYREEIPPDSIFYGKRRSLLALPEAFAQSPAVLADVHAAISHIFRFTKEEPSSVAIRREMQGTKDQLAQAIRDRALGEIEELRQTYVQIAEEFLTLLVDLGGGYTPEQARKERGNYFESWTEVRWLLSDLRELLFIASESGNTDVLGTIAFLPFAISIRAIQARDHFVFQHFYQFASLLYVLAIEKDADLPVRSWMVDKSWRWPKEIADLYIAPELDTATTSPDDIEQMRGFALYSLRVYQDLLKLMMDKRDVTEFVNVAHELRRLYRHFREEDHQTTVEILSAQVQHAHNDEQRRSLTQALEAAQKRQDVARALDAAMDQIFMALGGRILAQRLQAPGDAEIARLFDELTRFMPSTLQRLAAAFADASDRRASDEWGWSLWDAVADGEAHWVDSHTKLNQIFAVRALQLLAALPPESRAAVQFPVSRALADMARENNPQGVLSTLNLIEQSPEPWGIVLNTEAKSCIGILRERLIAVCIAEREFTAERTRMAVLDPQRVTAFQEELVRSFAESVRLRKILAAKRALESNLTRSPGPPVRSFGLNQIDDKNAFINQEHTHFGGWGRGYGEGMAHSEDEEVFAVMLKSVKDTRTITARGLTKKIGRVIAKSTLRDPIILQSVAFDVRYAEIDKSPHFTPNYSVDTQSPWRDFDGFMGLLTLEMRQIPVFNMRVRRTESQNRILILDAAQFLRWHQFAPEHEPGEQTYANGQLRIRVFDLNADLEQRNAIIAQNPAWLAQESDPVMYLRGRVLVQVLEEFHIEVLDASKAVCLSIAAAVGED